MTGAAGRREDDEPRGLELLQAVAENYEEAGIPLPLIPETMIGPLRVLGEAVIGCRTAPCPSAYDLEWFIEEAVAARAEDYVLFGEAGHGLNSYGYHWYLVAGHAALFVQLPYGGIYQPSDAIAADLQQAYDRANKLVQGIVAAADRGDIASDERILVIDSFRHGNMWTRQKGLSEPQWTAVDRPFEAALDSL